MLSKKTVFGQRVPLEILLMKNSYIHTQAHPMKVPNSTKLQKTMMIWLKVQG